MVSILFTKLSGTMKKIPIYYVRNFSGTDDNCMNRLIQSRL